MIQRYDVILWDFDGVILDSMEVRDLGFREIFKKYDTSLVNNLISFHRINGGLSRYLKIRYFYENILKESIDDQMVKKLASDFSKIMKKQLTKKEYLINDSLNYIRENYKRQLFHIVSGSDQEELRWLCKELGIKHYFVSIHGSPTPKKSLIQKLLTDNKYSKSHTCLIGDSINDYEAAEENKIDFIGYNNPSLKATIHSPFWFIDSFHVLGK